MPKTCRTDTFISGKPAISCVLVVAAGGGSSSGVPGIPETRFAKVAAVLGLFTSLAECADMQKPARQSKFRWNIIEISLERAFWKAALRITTDFGQGFGEG